MNVKITPLISM